MRELVEYGESLALKIESQFPYKAGDQARFDDMDPSLTHSLEAGKYQFCWWANAGEGIEFFSNDEEDLIEQVSEWVYVYIRESGSDPYNEEDDYECTFDSVMDTKIEVLLNVTVPRLAKLLQEQDVKYVWKQRRFFNTLETRLPKTRTIEIL